MKRMIVMMLFIGAMSLLPSCSARDEQVSEDAAAAKGGVLVDSQSGQEYSDNVLIISVPAEAPEKDIKDLFIRYNMEIIYEMPNLSMYTIKLSHPMTAEEIDNLIIELEKNSLILGVNKDYIIRLD